MRHWGRTPWAWKRRVAGLHLLPWCLVALVPSACHVHLITVEVQGPKSNVQSQDSGLSTAEDVQSPDEIMEDSVNVLMDEALQSIAEP